MEPELETSLLAYQAFSTLTHLVGLLGGFFDFAVFLALMIVALGRVRPIERGLGSAIAGLAATRFLCICGSRVLSAALGPLQLTDMNGAIPAVLLLISFVTLLLTVAVWGAVLFALVRLAGRVAR